MQGKEVESPGGETGTGCTASKDGTNQAIQDTHTKMR